MNLKTKKQQVWHEMFHKKFVAIFCALALVLLINQIVFTFVLTDRNKVKAFINNTSSFVQAITNLGNQTVAAGATNVTLAEFFLPDSVFFNDNIACNSNLSGNPCITALDVNGAIVAEFAGTVSDDDGLSYFWELDPNGLFNNSRFQSADHVCANSGTAPTCVYIDVDGDGDCTTGTQQYIVQPHETGGSFLPIVCANTGSMPDINISINAPWFHSEVVNNNGQWDYCGDSNTPGCADNSGSTLRYEDALCGGSTADSWEPAVEPIWDDINLNDQYDSGEPIYWDPATCLSGSGACSGWGAGCTANGGLASGDPLPSPFYSHGTANASCVFNDLNQNSLMDGLESEITGYCVAAISYNSLWGEEQTETIWLSTATADTTLKTAVQSPMCYHGQDRLADCDGANSSRTGDCETISAGDVLTPLTGSEYLCTDSLTSPTRIFIHSGYTTLCDTTNGTRLDLRAGSAPATIYTVVGSNWSFRDSNGNGTWQVGEGLYYNPNGPSGSPGLTFTGPVPFGVGSGYVYPAWTGNEGFVDNEMNPNNFFDGTEPVIIDWDMDGVYTAPVDITYIDQSDVPAYGDTLYDVTAAHNVCSDSNDLAVATCVYTDTDGTPCDGTVTSGRYYLGDVCALNTDSLIVTGDNWAVTDNVIDTTTDFLKESVPEQLINSNTDTDIYSTGGLVGGESIIYFNGPLGDLIFINGSDVSAAGDTLRVVDNAIDQVCSDTSGIYSLYLSTCIYIDATATTPCSSGDGTITYLRGSNCATSSDHRVVAADGWVTNEDGVTPVDASSDLILEIGSNPGIFDLNNTGPNLFPIYRVESTEIPGLACDDALWEDNGNTISGPVLPTLGNGLMDVGGFGFDYLNALALKNVGSALNNRDITNVRVYTDWWVTAGIFGHTSSDGRCTGHTGDTTDQLFTSMTIKNDGSWVTNYNNDVSNLYLGFIRACIVADIAPTAINGKTIALQFPQLTDSGTTGLYNSGDLGLFSYTGNNGLTGGAYTVPYTITISSSNVATPPSYNPPTPDTVPPGLVTAIVIKADSTGKVTITWKDPTDIDLKQIVVDEMVGNLSGGQVVVKGIQQLSLSGKIIGTTYQYRLRAEDNSGNLGAGQYYSVTIPASGEITVGTPALPTPEPGQPNLILQDPAPAGPLPVNVSVGALVKAANSGTIYFIDQDNRRHTFPNEKIYFSYYDDFSGLQILPDATLAAIPLGSNVTMRPGTWLVKIQSDFKVYAVEPYGVLRWISSEAVAAGLYGAAWSTRIVDVEPTFFTDYQMGSAVTANVHPTGTAFSYLNDPIVYYVDEATKRFISSAVFVNNKFQNKFIIRNVSTDIAYANGADWPILNMAAIMTLK